MCNTFSFGNNIEWKNYFKVKLESTFNDYLNNSFKKKMLKTFLRRSNTTSCWTIYWLRSEIFHYTCYAVCLPKVFWFSRKTRITLKIAKETTFLFFFFWYVLQSSFSVLLWASWFFFFSLHIFEKFVKYFFCL